MSDSGRLNVAWLYDDSLDRGDGVAQYIKTLGAWMSSQGHQVTYLVGQSKITSLNGGQVISLSKNIKVRWSGNRMSVPLKPRINLIKKIVEDNDFDIVHVTAPYSPLMAKQVIKRLSDKAALVGTWHIYPANSRSITGSRVLKLSYGRSLKRFDKFISVSAVAQDYAKQVFGVDSVVVPNVIKLLKPLAVSANKNPRIVYLGRLVERKGAVYLIRAFEQLLTDVPEAKLIIAGDGPLRNKIKALIRELKIENSVELVGYVDERQKFELLATADIACFPSLYGESFGVVLIEAMAAGSKVVLGGDNPGYQTVLGASPDQMIDPKLTADFAAHLKLLLTNEQLSNKLHNWQNHQLKFYDVEQVGPQIIDVYRQAIAKRQASGHN